MNRIMTRKKYNEHVKGYLKPFLFFVITENIQNASKASPRSSSKEVILFQYSFHIRVIPPGPNFIEPPNSRFFAYCTFVIS